jgi:hypothetical protein
VLAISPLLVVEVVVELVTTLFVALDGAGVEVGAEEAWDDGVELLLAEDNADDAILELVLEAGIGILVEVSGVEEINKVPECMAVDVTVAEVEVVTIGELVDGNMLDGSIVVVLVVNAWVVVSCVWTLDNVEDLLEPLVAIREEEVVAKRLAEGAEDPKMVVLDVMEAPAVDVVLRPVPVPENDDVVASEVVVEVAPPPPIPTPSVYDPAGVPEIKVKVVLEV